MNIPQVYAEVYEILNILGEKYINKLPKKLYNHIESERDKKIIVEIDINEDIINQDISEEACEIIAYFNLEYWCEEKKKQELLKHYKENDEFCEKKLREKYDPDSLFKEKKKDITKKSLVKVERENIFRKLMKMINSILKK